MILIEGRVDNRGHDMSCRLGRPGVLDGLRACRIGELTREELAEIVQDAWLSRASARRAAAWLNDHPLA